MMDSGNVTASGQYQYWDFLDGDATVCSPRGPVEYLSLCIFNRFCLGGGFAVEGLWLLYNARKLTHLSRIVKKKSGSMRAYINRLTYIFGWEFFLYGSAHVVGAYGTVQSVSTLRGIIGDFLMSFAGAFNAYHSLLQLRGADAFRNMVHLGPDENSNRMLLTVVLDCAQGPGAFILTCIIWTLLACGVLTRMHFYASLLLIMVLGGIRSLFKNILDRVRTIVRLNALQQNAGGDINALKRRRDILRKKARVLIWDMVVIFSMQIGFPLAALLSVNSSTQVLIVTSVFNTILCTIMFMLSLMTHSHVKRMSSSVATEAAKTNKSTSMALNSMAAPEYTVADESGLSIVNDVVSVGMNHNNEVPSVGGLFSEEQSRLSFSH
jgi:hypothetical protein